MRNRHLFTLTILASLTIFTGATFAQPTCEKTFTPEGDWGYWEDPDNWDPTGTPGAGHVACIPAGKTARVWFIHAEAEAVWIKADAQDVGRIDMLADQITQQPGSLTLYADSRVDGELAMIFGPELRIDGEITIDGIGKIMLWPDLPGDNFPIIMGTDGNAELTLEGANAGSWTPDEWDDRDDTLVLTGGGEINVDLVNQAHVVTVEEDVWMLISHVADRPLTITMDASGDGFWIAELNPDPEQRVDVGILDITGEVSGSGTFVVSDDSLAEIRVNDNSALSGDVLIYNGKFLVQEDFDTIGNLLMTNNAKIIASAGVLAYFDY